MALIVEGPSGLPEGPSLFLDSTIHAYLCMSLGLFHPSVAAD